ncbi:hypothetical protein GCM10028805_10210 [Spirosoma harenae]
MYLSRIVVFALLLISLGCQKSDDAVAIPQTITDRILEDSQFGLFQLAMAYGEVGDALKAGNMTLFAPTDAAFQASGLTAESIKAMTKDQARTFVLYHALYGKAPITTIPSGSNAVETASKGVAFVNKSTDGSTYINNAKLVQTDIVVANGYFHTIDRVLSPANGTMLATIQNNPNLTFLAAAVKRVSTSNPALVTALTSTTASSAVTVFAPTDAAFKADKTYNTIAAIESANPQNLVNILMYHIVSGALFSNQLQSGSFNTLSSGNKLIVTVGAGQITVKGAKNTTAASIKQSDLTTANGVIHLIDQVLQP